VLETRSAENATRRRRACTSCSHRFTTFERAEAEPLYVEKRDGSRQRFDRDKLRDALTRAAHKRPVHRRDISEIVSATEAMVAANGGELSSASIASHCLSVLRQLDRGAYLQFAGTLPEPNPDFADLGGAPGAGGSVRGASNHGQSTPMASTRRGLDG
jgi:transcriptional repressor NrdR